MPEMFANAMGYEQLMGRWSVRLAPLYADFAGVANVGRTLDVGCGTGALVKILADMTRETRIVGVDPAQCRLLLDGHVEGVRHPIPRYAGDVAGPSGGIRCVLAKRTAGR